jgi:dephospho-CoA kinase
VKARIGLTGGIGSGKSEVAKIFAARGALVIDADELAREAVAEGSEALRAIAARWPQAVKGGRLDRSALGRIVFNDAQARAELNAIVHPVVRRLGAEREAQAAPGQLVVHDVPLLFEGDFYRRCDANVLVVAPLLLRIARTMDRSGLSRHEVERRIAAQISPGRARALTDFTIENDGTLEELRRRAGDVYERLLALEPRARG